METLGGYSADSLQRYEAAQRWLAEVQADNNRYQSPEWLACIVELGEARQYVDVGGLRARQAASQPAAPPKDREHMDYTLPDTLVYDEA